MLNAPEISAERAKHDSPIRQKNHTFIGIYFYVRILVRSSSEPRTTISFIVSCENIQSVYLFCSVFLFFSLDLACSASRECFWYLCELNGFRWRCKQGDRKNGTFILCSNMPSLLALMVVCHRLNDNVENRVNKTGARQKKCAGTDTNFCHRIRKSTSWQH